MATHVRKFVPTDFIIGALREFAESLREEGCLNDHLLASAVISDVMERIGIPQAGIRMVLGEDMLYLTNKKINGHELPCSLCQCPAIHLVQVRDGFRLACENHAREAEEAGLSVITPQFVA